MQDSAVLEKPDVALEAQDLIGNGTSIEAVEACLERLRAMDPGHDMLLLLEAKLVALRIGLPSLTVSPSAWTPEATQQWAKSS